MSFLRFLRANAPFLLAGVMLSFGSSFGQTYFISVFAAKIMGELGLSHGAWGGIYAVGTTIAAGAMIWAGALTDRYRVRDLALVVVPALALTCVAMAFTPNALVLLPIIFALRLLGQGMMSHLAITAMARWFVAARGRALSVASMGFALGQALLPLTVVLLMEQYAWRTVWLASAVVLILGLPVLLRLLRSERTPQSVAEDSDSPGMYGRHWTRVAALRHWLFWLALPMIVGPPAWGTALFFQKVHVAEVKSWPLEQYFALFPVFTLFGVGMTILSGFLIDRFGTGRITIFYMLPWIAGFAVLSQTQTLGGAALAMALLGVGSGFQSTVPAAYWAEFYGTRHIGAIKSLALALMVFGSAIGPGISGLLIDLGVDFPQQMVYVSVFFGVAGIMIAVGILRALPLLRLPATAAPASTAAV